MFLSAFNVGDIDITEPPDDDLAGIKQLYFQMIKQWQKEPCLYYKNLCQFEEIIGKLQKYLDSDKPRTTIGAISAYFMSWQCYRQLFKIEQAEKAFNSFLDLFIKSYGDTMPKVLYELSGRLRGSPQYITEEVLLLEKLAQYPDSKLYLAAALESLSYLYLGLGFDKTAIYIYKEILRVAPVPENYYRLGVAYLFAEKEEGYRVLQELLKCFPNSLEAKITKLMLVAKTSCSKG